MINKEIKITPDNENQNKYIYFDLNQENKTIEVLSLKLEQNDIYQFFNADYGCLIGRVRANNGCVIPNARISIFIPIESDDQSNPEILSVYNYSSPTDKTNNKRYNLLPRVSEFNTESGIYKPKQVFGSFPIKPEIVTNNTLNTVYNRYYKYTAITNNSGDYMIFGCPVGIHTVHMSCDITDIGKYSMSPLSMIQMGYSPNLFTNDGTTIKSSTDLEDLPHIFTQEIAVNIVPLWGDSTNFQIGITQQDFRIRADIKPTFTIFGSSMTMGSQSTIGDPNRSGGSGDPATNDGFYKLKNTFQNNIDIRTFRPSDLTIRVFSYKQSVPIPAITGNTTTIDFNKDIFELDKSAYYEFNTGGDFVLSIPCNRTKKYVNNNGNEVLVDDNSSQGIFTEFYGMILFEYPTLTDLPFDGTFGNATFALQSGGGAKPYVERGWMKIPQSKGLLYDDGSNPTIAQNNYDWRKEHFKFEGGKFYSVAQFLATRWIHGSTNNDIVKQPYAVNTLDKIPVDTGAPTFDIGDVGGIFMKVSGTDNTTQTDIDEDNYILVPTGNTKAFIYDFPSNASAVYSGVKSSEKIFGAQWLNMSLVFPQFVTAGLYGNSRSYNVADVLFEDYEFPNGMTHFFNDNKQLLFANISGSTTLLSGKSYATDFIEISTSDIQKLYSIDTTRYVYYKGVNLYNLNSQIPELLIDFNSFKYRRPTGYTLTSNPGGIVHREYDITAFDENYRFYSGNTGNPNAYIFRGMYENDCIKRLFDLNFL